MELGGAHPPETEQQQGTCTQILLQGKGGELTVSLEIISLWLYLPDPLDTHGFITKS